jgi:hypothetical protein
MVDEVVLQRIINLINQQKVIPIIGYDLLNLSLPEPTDLLKYVVTVYGKENGLQTEPDPAVTANQYLNQVYYQLSDDKRENFNVEISDVIKKLRVNSPVIFEPLKKLSRINAFKFYVNATCTNSMEIAINTFRSSDPEAKKGYEVYNYRPSSSDLLQVPPHKLPLSVFPKPVIYNLLGVHGKNGDYVVTEADYIELIYDLVADRENKFAGFKDLLSRTSLLFLGCNFQDWFFKFFIRVCAKDKVDRGNTPSKAVIDMLKDPYRSEFISNYSIINIADNSAAFVDRLYSGLQKNNPELITEDVNNNRIFISYCWTDFELVNGIAEQFKSVYLDSYWRDTEKIETGDSLDERIANAVETASAVLFVITENIQSDQNINRFFWDEWALSLRLNKKILIVKAANIGDHIVLPGQKLTSEEKSKINQMIGKGGNLYYLLGNDNKLSAENLTQLKQLQIDSRIVNNL